MVSGLFWWSISRFRFELRWLRGFSCLGFARCLWFVVGFALASVLVGLCELLDLVFGCDLGLFCLVGFGVGDCG